MAALMLVPVGAITLNDGIRQLPEWTGYQPPTRLLALAAWAAPAALIVNVAFYQLFAFLAISGYTSTEPLGLHGAMLTRVAPQRAAALRVTVAAIERGCSSFLTLPGMASFYIWTDQHPPAQLYSGVWMYFLDSAQQQQVVAEVIGRPRLCVVRDQAILDFWAEGRPLPKRPLLEYINTNFVPLDMFGEYEVLTPP
jgi:hypothetical protein